MTSVPDDDCWPSLMSYVTVTECVALTRFAASSSIWLPVSVLASTGTMDHITAINIIMCLSIEVYDMLFISRYRSSCSESISTDRGLAPDAGPTMPAASNWSISRPARL